MFRKYDRHGNYDGNVKEDGRKYDKEGNYDGKIKEDGRKYDRQGNYDGKIKEDGRKYDKDGNYDGKIKKDGRKYDKDGNYDGRIELPKGIGIGGFEGSSGGEGGTGFGGFAAVIGIICVIIGIIAAWPAIIYVTGSAIKTGDAKQCIAGVVTIIVILITIICACRYARKPGDGYMENVCTMMTCIGLTTYVFVIIYTLIFEFEGMSLSLVFFYAPLFSAALCVLPAFIAEGIMRLFVDKRK